MHPLHTTCCGLRATARLVAVLLPAVLALPASHAQVQYWGVVPKPSNINVNIPYPPGYPLQMGGIIRVDADAMHPEIVLEFDAFETGMGRPHPYGGIMQASNGLIYYMTLQNGQPYQCRIIALDPVTDSAWTAATLGTEEFTWRGARGFSSLVEGEPGYLTDVTGSLGPAAAAFRFNIHTHTLSLITTLPTFVNGDGYTVKPTFLGTLTPASTGNLHGGTTPGQLSVLGAASRVDLAGNSYHVGPVSDPGDGYEINGPMLQVGDLLYLTTRKGGNTFSNPLWGPGLGTIAVYDPVAHTYQKLLDLDSTAYIPVYGFVAGSNGLLYGEAGTEPVPGINNPSCLFAYDPTTNTLERKVHFAEPPLGFAVTGRQEPRGLLAAGNGKIYGSLHKGLFEYDPVADTLRLRAPLQYTIGNPTFQYGPNAPLIEICRKPNYKPRPTTAFQVCAGSQFAYDLFNVNATNVVWRRNGVVVPAQASQRLEFAAIVPADAGEWACTLTNECGVTEPPPITITVQAGTFANSTISGDTLLCGTGDTALLTGNNGGTWNTGATTPTLAVTQPGTYYVTHQQACGISMSNSVQVAHLDSVHAPWLRDSYGQYYTGTTHICPGGEVLFQGNDPGPWGLTDTGVWSTGDTTASITVGVGDYYIVVQNACNTDTSNMAQVAYVPQPPQAVAHFLSAPNGAPVDNLLCGLDSVWLKALPDTVVPNPPNYSWLSRWFPGAPWGYVPGQSGGGFWVRSTDLAGYNPRPYRMSATWCNTLLYMDSVMVHWHEQAPQEPPVIIPEANPLFGCTQDTVVLSTEDWPVYWQWWTGSGYQQQYTSEVTVDWAIAGYGLYPYNGCGTGPATYTGINAIAAPEVAYTEASANVCLSHAPFLLTPGIPAGGTYTGPGVTGNMFDPATAGLGAHTITYSYHDGTCTGYAQATITVDLCMAIVDGPVEDHTITISPNPSMGTFHVGIARDLRKGLLLMYDAQGRRVGNTTRLVPGRNTIHQEELAPGTYQVRLEIDGQVEVRSVVIVR